MSLEQCVMVILTAVIAFCAVAQAIFIREQSDLLRRAQDLQTKASVRIISSGGPDYEGFTVVNLSVFPITISGWIIQVEQPAARRGSGKWTERVLPKAPAHNLQLPHRLERGNSVRVAFHRELAVDTLRRSDGTSERFRLAVQDTLGNTYRSERLDGARIEDRDGGSPMPHTRVHHSGGGPWPLNQPLLSDLKFACSETADRHVAIANSARIKGRVDYGKDEETSPTSKA